MEKTILKTGNEVFTVGMKDIDNVVSLALVVTLGTVIIVHDLIKHGYGADIELENKKVKVSFKPS